MTRGLASMDGGRAMVYNASIIKTDNIATNGAIYVFVSVINSKTYRY